MKQVEPLLPRIASRADYVSLQPDIATWLPAMRAICHRHNLPTAPLVRQGGGTNVVFALGEDSIIKLFPPYWKREAQADRSVATYIYGKLPVTTPQIYAYGELEGWPYIVMSRLKGTYLMDIWDSLDYENQRDLIISLGKLLASLHALPIAGFSGLELDWPVFIQQRLDQCQQHHREKGVAAHWLNQIPGYLERASPLYPPDYTPVILSADLHHYHLLVEPGDTDWQLCGFFDFDDARLGFYEYDFASAGLFMMRGRPDLLRTFLQSYGVTSTNLNEHLTHRLMAYTLLHRYRDLNWIIEDLVANPSITTLEELARAIYGLR